MYQTQLLKIRIRPGKTSAVIDFIRSLGERRDLSLAALRREGMVVESMFLERRDDGDYLYYYAKARDLTYASEVNMQATDGLAQEIRAFISETWDHIVSPEPLLDLDLIQEEAAPHGASGSIGEAAAKTRARRKPGSIGSKAEALGKAAAPAPHALAG
ncbi:MAG: hypothetical protein JF616_04720 [Fibrobacteres bacterium]|jgi:hypothetical protein|nr:hypothetical protein [Fibrobacterota bacterium]